MKKNIYLFLILVFCFVNEKSYSQILKSNFSSGYYVSCNSLNESFNKQSNAVWTNDFSNVNDWVVINEANNSYDWTIGTTGCQGLFPIPTIYSPTAINGFAIFDSDKHCNGKQKSSIVTTNPISLLGHNNVSLQFYQMYKRFYDSTFVYVSNDGLNWKKYNVNKYFTVDSMTPIANLVKINITEIAANKPSVWIKFTYFSDTLTMGPQAGCNYAWMIDDVSIVDIPNNGLVVDKVYFSEYSKIPKGQQMPINFAADVLNQSPITRHNVQLQVKVNTSLYNYTTGLGDSLYLGENRIYSLTNSFNPTSIGIYAVDFNVLQTELDPNPLDDSKRVYFAITDSIYARDNYYYSGSGYWNGNLKPYEMGNIFHTVSTKIASSITFVAQGNTQQGAGIKAKIYKKTNSGFSLVAQSATHIISSAEIPSIYGLNPVSITIKFDGDPIVLEPNSDYLATIAYEGGNKNCVIADGSYIIQPNNSSYIYDTPNTRWVSTDYTPMIRLNLAYCDLNLSVSSVSDTCMSGKGKATVTSQNGTSPFFYNWSSSTIQHNDSSTTINLSAGIYSIAVADSRGCTGSSSVIVENIPVSFQMTTNAVNAMCGNANGIASVQNVSGGTPPYSYLWNTLPSQENDSSASINLLPGIYAVTITDFKGCKADTSVIIQSNNIDIDFNTSSVASSCNLPNGKAIVSEVINGLQPFYYKWSTNPVQTDDTAHNVLSGWIKVTVTDSNGCFGKDSVNVINNLNQPTVTVGTTSTSMCALSDGKAWVNHPDPDIYEYTWSTNPIQSTDTAFNLSAGIYNVIVTETSTGCSDTVYINVNDGMAPTITIDSTKNVLCFGSQTGEIYTSFSMPPTANFKFINTSIIPNDTIISASGDLTGLKAGLYKIIGYSGLCLSTHEVLISEPSKIVYSFDAINVKCNKGNDGILNSQASGGSGSLNFMWIKSGAPNDTIAYTNNYNGVEAGKYYIVISDANQCKVVDSINVSEPLPAVIELESSDIICNGQNSGLASVVSLLNALPPYTFLWSNGSNAQNLNSLAQGNYKLTVTDYNNCVIIDSVSIMQPNAIVISISSLDSAHVGVAEGAITVTANGGTGSLLSYQWSNGINGPSITNLLPDVAYTVTVTDANNCSQTATYIVPKTYIGTIEYEDNQQISIYPNPVRDDIFISINNIKSNNHLLQIFNSKSIKVREQLLTSYDGRAFETINLSNLNTGVYIVIISTDTYRLVRKIIKL